MRNVAAVVLPFLLTPMLSAQDQLTKQALQRIERVEGQEPKLAAGDPAIAGCLADLDWATKRLNAAYKKDEPVWKQAAERCKAVRSKLEAKAAGGKAPAAGSGAGVDRAALAQLDKEIGNAIHNFELAPPAMYQDDSRSRPVRQQLEQLGARLAAFPAADGDVAKVVARLDAFRGKFDAVMQKVAADRAGGGDMQRQLEALSQQFDAANLPEPLQAPLDEARVRAFLTRLQQLRRDELPKAQAVLAQAAQNGALDQQRVSSLQHWIGGNWPRRLDELSSALVQRVESDVGTVVQHAEWLLATDAKDRDQITNRVLGKGRLDEHVGRLRVGLTAIAVARVHDELAGGKPAADRDAQQQLVEKASAHLQQLAVVALEAVRMPTPKSTDPELLAIAESTLKAPSYGVKPWRRLVINTEKVRRERREGTARADTTVVRVTTYHYVWDEFQVTTAEPDGDRIWLHVNTLKYFHSGDSTTPIGRWILSDRFASTPILAENVDR